ncbi:hypothetical protein D3C85_15650 [compost metagenome]
MCRRLGKNHFQYVGTEGLERLAVEKSHWNPKTRLSKMYRVNILLTETALRDVLWNPQCNHRSGISAKLAPAKQRLFDKLNRYLDRSHLGK